MTVTTEGRDDAGPRSSPGGPMSGGRALAEMLRISGAGPMFGMAGFQLLPYYEAVRVLGMEHHLVNDERIGAFAADAYARLTGRPGICDGTLGPGATNLVTGLVESLNAGVPVIALTGNTHRGHSWKNMTQEARQVEILRPAVKELIRVEAVERIPELVRRAFSVATSGRPGPVVLDVPEDVAHAEHVFAAEDFFADPATARVPARRPRPDASEVERAAALLAQARRPLILAGGGVHLSGAHDALLRLAEGAGIPVAHTLSGKGAIPCVHDLSVGLFGRYSRYANELIESSDCLLVVGCKLGEIATKRYALPRPGTPLIHLDIVAEEIGRWAPTQVGLFGDAHSGLSDLATALESAKPADRSAYLRELRERRSAWHAEARPRYESDEVPVNMGRVVGEINRALPEDGVLIADGGFASHWAGLLHDTRRAGRGFVADRGFASIGYGLPGALGAALAVRAECGSAAPVVSITGDSGLNMTIGDLETARRAGVAFTLVVVNNAASGYIKALQHAVYGEGHYQSASLIETNYAELARNFGCHGHRVEHPDDLGPALKQAMSAHDAPTVVDVVVTRDPARMLPGVDNRTLQVRPGDRPV
ncbi:thiamine pyrophosphate-binding protein [Actinomadura madurae]|uniref:thiamine pyrophosphate-binding protein n=3 Tax=Actinomadura madurae TaxID=1993 RepID=UPI002025C14D|nr:thiamine pyrophosphate-binding protein [Actinomadura madurae]MCP9953866.1 thiamine pyrophosphate-binding protein [Actinomadura madurae]MCP9983087.1 thiamine pyrophosphate-binding protein [Actinomadura madurae]URN10027.1 thiamine pyrophosphate-binding protein [Actinomadura madurae]